MAVRNDYIELFFTYVLAERRLSQNTFFAYKQDIEQFIQFLKTKHCTLSTCKPEYLKQFLKHLKEAGLSARTLSRKISALKALFNFMSERYRAENFGKYLIFPRLEKKMPVYLHESEIAALFAAAQKDTTPKGLRNKVMLYVLYASGMRVSELVSLTKNQIHFQEGCLKVHGKGSKERIIPLPNPILEMLRDYLDSIYSRLLPKKVIAAHATEILEQKEYLFISGYDDQCKPMTRQSFWLILKKLLGIAGISQAISPHSLRHSLATHLLRNGADLRTLQILLGHASIATVTMYTHLDVSQLREVYDAKHPRRKAKK